MSEKNCYCNLTRVIIKEVFLSLDYKRVKKKPFLYNINNIIEIEELVQTAYFDVICNLAFIDTEKCKEKIFEKIRKLEPLISEEAFAYIEKHIEMHAKKNVCKKKIAQFLKSEQAKRVMILIHSNEFELIKEYEKRGLA